MRYHLSNLRVKEIVKDESLAKEEAIKMKECFDKQGNQKHSFEGSTNYAVAVQLEYVFELIKTEFFKL